MRIIRLAVWSKGRKSAVVSRRGLSSRLPGSFGRRNPQGAEAARHHPGAIGGTRRSASELSGACGTRGGIGVVGVVAEYRKGVGGAGKGPGDGNLTGGRRDSGGGTEMGSMGIRGRMGPSGRALLAQGHHGKDLPVGHWDAGREFEI